MTQYSEGIIRKCIGGFYYVEAADAIYECHARGIFRKSHITPVAGDRAKILLQSDGCGSIEEIDERRNSLIRPPVANLDFLVVVASIMEPNPSTLVMDKMIAIAEKNNIEPVVVVNKADLQDTAWLEDIYCHAKIPVFSVSASNGQGVDSLREFLTGKISAFTGNSGVGKSSILNAIDPHFSLQTGEISKKLGRGRHTTRTAELFKLPGGGYIVDTPGFSSLELERVERIYKEELVYCFREFVPYLGRCRFTSCTHIKENGCAILDAVVKGEISPQRHESYVAMVDEVKNFKTWN